MIRVKTQRTFRRRGKREDEKEREGEKEWVKICTVFNSRTDQRKVDRELQFKMTSQDLALLPVTAVFAKTACNLREPPFIGNLFESTAESSST